MATTLSRPKSPDPPSRARAKGLARGLLLGLALAAGPAWAAIGAAAPAPAARGGDADRPAARVAYAGARRDTLPYSWRDVYPVAIEQLVADDWTIQRADTASRRVVTHWKPLKHVLARILLGTVMARCVLDVVPLSDGRTELTIQAGLASAADIEGNPGYSAAVAVYQGAAARWLGRVSAAMDERSRRGAVTRVALAR